MKTSLAVLAALLFSAQVSAQSFAPLRTGEQFSPSGTLSKGQGGSLIEEGDLNGVSYRFHYADGGGEFRSGNTVWNVVCQKDAISDKASCYMSSGDLLVFVRPKGVTTISIGSNHYPRTPITIRVDKGKPHSAPNGGPFGAQASKGIVKQLSTSGTVTTRYMEWPHDVWDDKTFETKGFNEAYSYLVWAVERLN